MQSKAKDVTTYLEGFPAERNAALAGLRDLCRKFPTDFEESRAYGGPRTNAMVKWKSDLPARSTSLARISSAGDKH
jgi:hypothetical protein